MGVMRSPCAPQPLPLRPCCLGSGTSANIRATCCGALCRQSCGHHGLHSRRVHRMGASPGWCGSSRSGCSRLLPGCGLLERIGIDLRLAVWQAGALVEEVSASASSFFFGLGCLLLPPSTTLVRVEAADRNSITFGVDATTESQRWELVGIHGARTALKCRGQLPYRRNPLRCCCG